jgi:hypothetical protein
MKRILLAGGITYLADEYSSVPEYRGWIGFGLSSALGVIGELLSGSNSSGLDMASHAVGSAIGAFVTDKWILQPVVKRENAVSSCYGVELNLGF